MSNSMKAWLLHGPNDLRCEEVARPVPAAGEVLVQIRSAGICGSDLHYFRDGRCGAFVPTRPFVPGHEFAGTVVDLGDGVDPELEGAKVAVDPSRACGRCTRCQEGRYNLCPHMMYYGTASVVPPADGCFAEYVVAPARNCVRLPGNMSFSWGALIEPMSVAAHAVNRSGGVSGRSVLITGGGTVGQSLLLVAHDGDAESIAVSDPRVVARSFVERAGGSPLDPAAPDFTERASGLAPGGFDVVFEASGSARGLEDTVRLARPGATVIQVGTLENSTAAPLNSMLTKELSYVASFRFAHVFQHVVERIASGHIQPGHLVTHTFPFDALPDAMKAAAAEDSVKVQLRI